MKTELERFHETVGILVKAYFDDELEHQNCRACAVGNICKGSQLWKFLFVTSDETGIQSPYLDLVKEISDGFVQDVLDNFGISTEDEALFLAKKVCAETGYSIDQLKRIEYAFEMSEKPNIDCNTKDPVWMFNGLMAVVDVLADIHGIDLEQKESAKLLFVK